MITLSTEVGETQLGALEDTFAVIFKGEELRGFVPDELLEPSPLPPCPGAGTVIRVIHLTEE